MPEASPPGLGFIENAGSGCDGGLVSDLKLRPGHLSAVPVRGGGPIRRPARSYGDGTNECVEPARLFDAIGVRNSKDPDDGPVLKLGQAELAGLLSAIEAGRRSFG